MASRDGERREETTGSAQTEQADRTGKDTTQDEQRSDEASGQNKNKMEDCTDSWEDEGYLKAGQEEYRKFKESDDDKKGAMAKGAGLDDGDDATANDEQSKKRGQGANSVQSANKKQKNGDSSAKAGDKTRVPEEGQQAQWEAEGGAAEGEVVEALYEEKVVEGEVVQGSKEEPQVVLRDRSSGKTAVQDPTDVKFD